jgi:capsular polysaccharide biosynthesis protein
VRSLAGLARRVGRRLQRLAPRSRPAPSVVLRPGGDTREPRDVWTAPALGLAVDAQGQVFGATADLARLPGAWRSGETIRFTPPGDAPPLAAGVLFMDGRATRNYAHFLLDALPVLLRTEPVAVLAPPLAPWQTQLVALSGASPPIEIAAPLVRVARLTFAAGGTALHAGPHLDAVRAAILAGLDIPPAPPRRIYVSRRDSLKAVMADELTLETILEARGYRILRPETASVGALIAAFRDAERVVAASGTLLANLLFCAPGTQVIELRPPGETSAWVEDLARHAGLSWKPYAAEEAADTAEVLLDIELRPASAFGWRLDLPAFLAFLDGEG